MPLVEIYTQPFCPYCRRAKALLDKKGVSYTEIDVMSTPGKRAEMRSRAGGRNTVPQIFVDGEHIGDSDELLELDRRSQLDRILKVGDNRR